MSLRKGRENDEVSEELTVKLYIKETKSLEHRYNVYISRPTRYTNSYNESLLIIKLSTCFGLLSPSSGATFWSCISQLV